jgi:3-hydroxyacyl-CoA dehydrogenase
MGYEEVLNGRIPVGGGLAEIAWRVAADLPEGADPVPAIEARFQALVTGRSTGNALEARRAGLLRPGDGITMNPARLLADAKAMALARSRTPASPDPLEDRVRAAGLPGLARLRLDLYLRREAAAIDEASAAAGLQAARILCGGEISGPQEVPRSYLLNLERQALLALCRPGT